MAVMDACMPPSAPNALHARLAPKPLAMVTVPILNLSYLVQSTFVGGSVDCRLVGNGGDTTLAAPTTPGSRAWVDPFRALVLGRRYTFLSRPWKSVASVERSKRHALRLLAPLSCWRTHLSAFTPHRPLCIPARMAHALLQPE